MAREDYYQDPADSNYYTARNSAFDDCVSRSCKDGNIERVKLRISEGMDVTIHNNEGLFQACINGHAKLAQLLLDNGADKNARQVLAFASERGHTEVVRVLLNQGADVHAGQEYALCMAAEKQHIEIMKLLLDHGADRHIWSDGPLGGLLATATYRGHTEVAKVLREHPYPTPHATGPARPTVARSDPPTSGTGLGTKE